MCTVYTWRIGDPEERGHLFEVTWLVTGRTQVAQRSGSSGGQGLGHQGRGWGGGGSGAELRAGVRTGEGAWHLPGCGGMSDLTAAQAGAEGWERPRPAVPSCRESAAGAGGSAAGLLA